MNSATEGRPQPQRVYEAKNESPRKAVICWWPPALKKYAPGESFLILSQL